jgi:two-component system, OmpR family, alkaline phosphatase synthesis response regulator PhoP
VSARIVIADDSATILALVELAVRRDGYDPVTAVDGPRALAAIREHRPELVIIDAMMPGASGYEVCAAVRADPELPQPHLIMLTAAGRDADRERAEEVGVDEFFAKPFSPSALRARVRAILGDP